MTPTAQDPTPFVADSSGVITPKEAIEYRPDIDGLRAIAVLSVVLFHLSRTALPGGYFGVDIFFVLSGFLITSIIWREGLAGDFSIVRFYDRRLRRIMPALLLVLIASTTVAAVLLLPSDLVGYSKSLLATLGFVANVYFWRDINYFAPVAEERPLLHLWSLGVEEQFYIFFPLIIALLARRWKRGALPVILGIVLASFALNALALLVDASLPAFFLLPARGWELGLGAVLAVLPRTFRLQAFSGSILAAIGLALIAFGLVHPEPQWQLIPVALPAVAGTALLLFAGGAKDNIVSRALTVRPLVFVGLLSYSLYLWHWPIIVLWKYFLVRDFTPMEAGSAFALMMACAVLSWRYVERPMRSSAMSIRTVRWTAVAGVAGLAVVSSSLIALKGLPQRLGSDAATINAAVASNYRCPVQDYLSAGLSRACAMNLPSRAPDDAQIVLIGNSHAQMYAPLWSSILAEAQRPGLLIPVTGCLPTPEANLSVKCSEAARRNLATVLQLPKVRTVVLGLTWWHGVGDLLGPDGRVLDNRDNAALSAALDELITQLQAAGKQVVLIGPLAEPGWDIASQLSRRLAFGHPVDRPISMDSAEFNQRFHTVLAHFSERSDIGFARPDRIQCDARQCAFLKEGHSLFADGNHLAEAELPRFRGEFAQALQRAAR